MFSSLLRLLKGTPSFYDDVQPKQIERYQHYVDTILTAVDIENSTKWSRGDKDYDRQRLATDDTVMENIILGQASPEGLSPVYLQIMVNQYFFADPYKREADRTQWVRRVLRRDKVDYFPDPWAVRKTLEASS